MRLARAVLAAHPAAGDVQVVLTDDEHIRRLNATFRGQGRATDVLSFDLRTDDGFAGEAAAVAGEVYISVPRAQAQAREQRVPLLTELGRLLVHGLLHLAGWEHDTPARLRRMERRTDLLLAQAGLLAGLETH
jgi:probable rRNA maturation factor